METMMKKTFVLLLFAIAGCVLVSCIRDTVSYCPFCGSSNLKEISSYDKVSGITTIKYECRNSNCGREFGAGKI
jgi:transposase-like protein